MTIDWAAPAKLVERDDSGSEMAYHFRDIAAGQLSDLVSHVMVMTAAERARVVIDAGVVGTFTVAQIVELSAREDFPRA
jgi:hypothetical protein